MPHGQLFINGKDAYDQWGISMDTTSLSALMTPAPMKEPVMNQSRLDHGVRVYTSTQRVAERQVNLNVQLCAPTESAFFSRYLSFCTELETGFLNIKTSFQPNVVYKCRYISCTQFTQFVRGIAKFSLRLEEMNPKDRSV